MTDSASLAAQIEDRIRSYDDLPMIASNEKVRHRACHVANLISANLPAIITALRADQRCAELEAENARLREVIANQANSFNIVGSHYDAAVTALGAMVSEVKRNARAALGQPR